MITDDNSVLAKSDGSSLLNHIRHCLEIFRGLRAALPLLPEVSEKKNFFEMLFFSVYLHDWGKAHAEFQKILRGRRSVLWLNSRHEFYSVPFVDMLPTDAADRRSVARVILGHHKDFEALLPHLYSKEVIEAYEKNLKGGEVNPVDFDANFRKKLDFHYLKKLKQGLGDFYQEYLGRPFDAVFNPVAPSRAHPVQVYAVPFLKDNTGSGPGNGYWQEMLLSGAMKLCDHMGSAEIREIPVLCPCHFDFLRKFDGQWFAHQAECGKAEGNLLMTAPTGSGKTEAALLWIKRQLKSGHQGRIFYILPYTASINAMHGRLVRDFEGWEADPGNSRYVGLVHGKLGQYLAQYFEDKDGDPRKFSAHLRKIKDLHKKMVHPLKVVTPFQLLKYCYGVRGAEMGFAQLAGAMLVFDEIHAYDMQTFAQIVVSLKWLITRLRVRVMIMTATLPGFMLEELQDAVGMSGFVRADDALMARFSRHRVELLDGGIFDQADKIQDALDSGKRVMLICNTVANAQDVFQAFARGLEENESVLLHSRFTGQDRMEKEQRLSEGGIRLLAGTQAIEVSLDIDFDVMFTEPAPLDALIQRFGRINRRCRKGICPVYVCREGGENDHYIYPRDVVERTLDVLEEVSVIEERHLRAMLDQVYPEQSDKEKYEEIKKGFLSSLERLRPFMPFKEQEEEFYKQFTGVPVLPAMFRKAYENCCQACDFIMAERLFVNLHVGMFHKLLNQELVEKNAAVSPSGSRLKEIPYWLARCRYSRELGLSDEEDVSEDTSADYF
ncbi:CRISPR-associated helicase Cas3' [Desulfonema magnum]|uniref:CRISPR-associated helicase, Cas3-like n=1 Tax=Desulfonema magnum TaxID=45655 RepID=A0A975BXS0_9BACT|nr:CRISPR-associated helicase Cas3' [Desulfonema magnum]QTA93739.1 CRISPR-associated helicase, Cas3-like [Desulfonema magnum]